jgi:streptogramin lyase
MWGREDDLFRGSLRSQTPNLPRKILNFWRISGGKDRRYVLYTPEGAVYLLRRQRSYIAKADNFQGKPSTLTQT